MTSNSEARQIIIESLTFENTNAQCNSVIQPLKARSAPLEKWIRDTINIVSLDHNDAWV